MTSSRDSESTWGWGTGAWGWNVSEDGSTRGAANEDDLMDEVRERLSAAFAPLLEADTVTAVVRQCHRELVDAESPALPEALEQLARRRLYEMTAAYAIAGVANTGPAASSSAYLIIRSLAE